MTRRVFVANRGEIALRIIEACDRLGYETVLGVSAADRDSLPARRAGRVVALGPADAARSYLSLDIVVQAAVSTGCHLLHPGYGFLSERAELAELCEEQGLIFVGPSAEVLRTLGDKLSARKLAVELGIPVAQGGTASSVEKAHDLAERVGYPVLIKAAFGGGGRGMKRVEDPAELREAWPVATAEAESAFGDGTIFLERFVREARHVEVQVLGDRTGRVLHLGERECSVQYRYQKVFEEAPCAALSSTARAVLHDSAVRLTSAVKYVGLGTVEFLYDSDRDELTFLEVNPRLQVEHGVTEAVTGIDLVREQLLVVQGQPLSFAQEDVRISGHAIEARLTAQDPDRSLAPSPGRITRWRPPSLGGLRLDTHLYEGYLFPPQYDALMAKVIAAGPTREEARKLLVDVLDRLEVQGPATSLPLLRRIASSAAFAGNTVSTSWLAQAMAEGSV